jgi:hypothetical protein
MIIPEMNPMVELTAESVVFVEAAKGVSERILMSSRGG